MATEFKKSAHGVYNIHLHICLITKYRYKVLTEDMLSEMEEIFTKILESRRYELEEFNGEPDHVHLLIQLHPDNNIAQLISSLKSASSRTLRKTYKNELKCYWGNPKLWHDSKCIVSCGGAPLQIVKDYI
jgi:putative transposase